MLRLTRSLLSQSIYPRRGLPPGPKLGRLCDSAYIATCGSPDRSSPFLSLPAIVCRKVNNLRLLLLGLFSHTSVGHGNLDGCASDRDHGAEAHCIVVYGLLRAKAKGGVVLFRSIHPPAASALDGGAQRDGLPGILYTHRGTMLDQILIYAFPV